MMSYETRLHELCERYIAVIFDIKPYISLCADKDRVEIHKQIISTLKLMFSIDDEEKIRSNTEDITDNLDCILRIETGQNIKKNELIDNARKLRELFIKRVKELKFDNMKENHGE